MVGLFRDEHPHVVCAHKPGLVRKNAHISGFIDPNPEIPRFDIEALVDNRGKRRQPHMLGVELQQNVMHGRVSHNGHVHEVVGCEAKRGGISS
jgi:hypothetical protein